MRTRSSWARLWPLLALTLLGACGKMDVAPNAIMSKEAAPEEMAAPMQAMSADQAASSPEKKSKEEGGSSQQRVETWKRSELAPHTSQLKIGDSEVLPLKGLQAFLEVDGFRARVVLDLYYYNERDAQYEGDFKLRLPPEAVPYYFAFGAEAVEAKPITSPDTRFLPAEETAKAGLEVTAIQQARKMRWENVKEARMVPKEKAAQAYRDTVRRSVDPALMEWSGAGVFSARVFPLVPKRLHRLVIGYDVTLSEAGQDLVYTFDIPQDAGPVRVHLSVAELGSTSIEVTPTTTPSPLEGRLHYDYQGTGQSLTSLQLRLVNPGPLLLTGEDSSTGPYFAARFFPSLPTSSAAAGKRPALFLIDTSLSSHPDRFNIFLALTQAILEANRETLPSFGVLFFNIEQRWWTPELQENSEATQQVFRSFANSLALEGASDLSAALAEAGRKASEIKASSGADVDLFLLSDGAATWGEVDPGLVLSRLTSPLYAYSTGMAGTDTAVLSRLSRETGGALFTVAGESEIKTAAVAHRARPFRLGKVTLEGGTDLLLAGRPTTLYPGQPLTLVGRGTPARGAKVALEVEQNGSLRTVTVPLKTSLSSALAPRAYGAVATGLLEEFETFTESVSRAYACHFRITGKTSSLLMLESEADYERYQIKPQEDAFVVSSTPASGLVEKTLATLGAALTDPRLRFKRWLEKMQKLPGFTLELPDALMIALERMPEASFEVVPEPLLCKAYRWSDVPGTLQEMWSSKNLDYDVIVNEAERRQRQFGTPDALKVLSTLVEQNPGDAILSRDVGLSAMGWGLGGQSYHLFRRVAESRPFEPQTYLMMAQALSEMEHADLSLLYYEVGLQGQWDGRFGEFRKILGLDYLRFLRRIAKGELKTSVPDYAAARLQTVSKEFDVGKADLGIVITWNTDGTDVDLHVIEPSGEECYYSHRQTRSGGEITQDVTQGYGPEMYILPSAPKGTYVIKVKYYASDRNRASARSKVYATIFEKWGTEDERVNRHVVTLVEGKDMLEVARVKVAQ